MEERNIDRINDILEKAKSQGWLDGFDFSILMQRLLIPDGGYILCTAHGWKKTACRSAQIAVKNTNGMTTVHLTARTAEQK